MHRRKVVAVQIDAENHAVADGRALADRALSSEGGRSVERVAATYQLGERIRSVEAREVMDLLECSAVFVDLEDDAVSVHTARRRRAVENAADVQDPGVRPFTIHGVA